MTRPSGIQQVFRRLGFSTACLAGLLFLAEVGLRLFAPFHFASHIREAREFDSELGVRKRASVHTFKSVDYQAETIANSDGTSNFFDNYGDYDVLVFAIGDSYTEGAGVPADCSFPFQLDVLLNVDESGRYSRKYAIVNLGLSGYGTQQQTIMLNRYAERIGAPDFVLLLGCDNDFGDDQLLNSGYKHLSYVKNNPNHFEITNRLAAGIEKIELVKRFFMLRNTLIYRKLKIEPGDIATAKESTAKKQAEKLETIHDLCRDFGADLIVSWVTQPEQANSYEWLKEWAHNRNLKFADYAPLVEDFHAHKPALTIRNQHSTKHFRSWVNQLIARSFASAVNEVEDNGNTDHDDSSPE